MSRYIAESDARIFVTLGLPVVMVDPALVIGMNDIGPTRSGQMIIGVVKQKMPGFIDGENNIVDVENVAHGHILAAEKSRVG